MDKSKTQLNSHGLPRKRQGYSLFKGNQPRCSDSWCRVLSCLVIRLCLITSAFNRINVRRLFIVLEKAIATAAKFQLFEFNDHFTRAQFVALVEPFLRDVQGRRGVYDFRVVCDDTNNTSAVVDANEFRLIFLSNLPSLSTSLR